MRRTKGGFLLDNFVTLLHRFGIDYAPAAPSIVLPVGISFYTFQTLSYTIDVYRGNSPPWRSFLDFALFVTFFPQLVAGPIVRAVDFLPQCSMPRKANAQQMGWGLSLLTLGIFEKTAIADGLLAPIADKVYAEAFNATTMDAWVGTLAFSGQIFCDFAGYSTCAIGVALCLGFALPDNFRYPYAAVGFSDFWRRWHISLSTWLRDYLYISLGGNRKGQARTLANLMITMLLGGLWHGAAWTFVFWGALHGAYLMVERLLRAYLPPLRFWTSLPGQLFLMLGTYFWVCIAWVFFRSQGFASAWVMIGHMFGHHPGATWSNVKTNEAAMVLVLTAVLLGIHWLLRNTTLEAAAARIPWFLHALVLAVLLLGIVTMGGDDRAFIYFQF